MPIASTVEMITSATYLTADAANTSQLSIRLTAGATNMIGMIAIRNLPVSRTASKGITPVSSAANIRTMP